MRYTLVIALTRLLEQISNDQCTACCVALDVVKNSSAEVTCNHMIMYVWPRHASPSK